MERNIKTYVQKVEEIEFCKSKIYHLTFRGFELPFKIDLIPSDLHDPLTCENCLKSRLKIIADLKPRFAKFPNCCEAHSKLLSEADFDKKKFGDVPTEIGDKVLYTYHYIVTNTEKDDWFLEITNYIDWATHSLGQLPSGEPLFYCSFFEYLIDIVNRGAQIEEAKKEKILEYLRASVTPAKDNTDL